MAFEPAKLLWLIQRDFLRKFFLQNYDIHVSKFCMNFFCHGKCL